MKFPKDNAGKLIPGAMFADLGDLPRHLPNESMNPEELVLLALAELRKHAKEYLGISIIQARAYTPPDNFFSPEFIKELALAGISPVRARAVTSKHVTRLMLAMDVMETLLRKSEIVIFIIIFVDIAYMSLADRIR